MEDIRSIYSVFVSHLYEFEFNCLFSWFIRLFKANIYEEDEEKITYFLIIIKIVVNSYSLSLTSGLCLKDTEHALTQLDCSKKIFAWKWSIQEQYCLLHRHVQKGGLTILELGNFHCLWRVCPRTFTISYTEKWTNFSEKSRIFLHFSRQGSFSSHRIWSNFVENLVFFPPPLWITNKTRSPVNAHVFQPVQRQSVLFQ